MGRFSDFKLHEQGLEKALGGLETKIMNAVWAMDRCTVRDVHDRLRANDDLAYTTVMTVMTRLAAKGFLKREMVEGSYVYSPALTKKEFESSLVGEVLDSLLESFSEETIAHLVERVGRRVDSQAQVKMGEQDRYSAKAQQGNKTNETDADDLDDLAKLIAQRRMGK